MAGNEGLGGWGERAGVEIRRLQSRWVGAVCVGGGGRGRGRGSCSRVRMGGGGVRESIGGWCCMGRRGAGGSSLWDRGRGGSGGCQEAVQRHLTALKPWGLLVLCVGYIYRVAKAGLNRRWPS